MIRLSEEQQAILNCYSGTKEDVIAELGRAIIFIEDFELRESTQKLLEAIKNMSVEDYDFYCETDSLILLDVEE